MGRYLARSRLTRQRPQRRAYERKPVAVRRWLQEEYPAIEKPAKAQQGEIHWGDQMGLRSAHQTGTSYGRRGRTPVIPGRGHRFRCNMMSTITNRGHVEFTVVKKRLTPAACIRLPRRLVHHASGKVLLILERHLVHRSAKVNRWLPANHGKIVLFFLPGCSPGLNPNEILNHDVKSNALGRRRSANQIDMIAGVRSDLRGT